MEPAFSSGLSSAFAGGSDTVVARATPEGRGALAVVRLSGPEAGRIAGEVCSGLDVGRPWRAQLVELRDDLGFEERAVAIPYRSPRSATGEDMVELILHGSPFVVDSLLERCRAAGARPAEPGEFTRRAVANGKLDLLQAEAVRDVIAAETRFEYQSAQRQLRGELSVELSRLRSDLTRLLARLEAGLDFVTQDIDPSTGATAEDLAGAREAVAGLLEGARRRELARGGVRIVLVGAPNAGKSTLFNRLLGRPRAIVADGPGTTRDVLEAATEIAGVRAVLVDTAGLGTGRDEVEREGMARAEAALAEAHVAVVMWPAGMPGGRPEVVLPPGAVRVLVRSKADLGAEGGDGWLRVSAQSGEGQAELEARLASAVREVAGHEDGPAPLGARHRQALERALDELAEIDLGTPEVAAEGVRWALAALAELTGEVLTEDVLDEVFATFCIGK